MWLGGLQSVFQICKCRPCDKHKLCYYDNMWRCCCAATVAASPSGVVVLRINDGISGYLRRLYLHVGVTDFQSLPPSLPRPKRTISYLSSSLFTLSPQAVSAILRNYRQKYYQTPSKSVP